MARDKKAKKGLEEETGEEEVVSKNLSKESIPDNVAAAKSSKKGKKGKKDLIDHVLDDEDDVTMEEKVPTSKKTRKSKILEDDVEDGSTTLEEDLKKEKRSKKAKSAADANALSKASHKKKKADVESNEGSDVDDNNRTTIPRKSDKPVGFGLLDIEGEDGDEHNDDFNMDDQPIKNTPESVSIENGLGDMKKGGKKSKKKERRKKPEEDEEDLDKLLAELALEMNGEQTPQVAETVKADLPSTEAAVIDTKQSKKKKKKGADADETDKVESQEPSVEMEDQEQQSTVKTAAQTKREKKEKKVSNVEISGDLESQEPSAEDGGEEPQSTVKTAAQKKREKKEKEKQKKAAQFEQGRSVKKNVDESKPQKAAATAETAAPELEILDVEEGKEDGEDDDKKKKKKRKADDDDKKDKKRPGKRQIAAMQEALKKVREEEERLKLEEEAKMKAAEEAENLRQEKLRLEQERKEKKKLKEKEKRERLKAEGKLLSKNQRQNRARMEATLAALRQQGVEVPQIGEKKERAPRLGDRKRIPKKRNENTQEEDKDENTEVPMDTKESSPEIEAIEEKVEEMPGEEEEEEDVKDAWDESSEEEEEEESDGSTKGEIVVQRKHNSKEDAEDSESDDSQSSDEDSSETDESSSESEGEGKRNEEKVRERVIERIRKRREVNETNRSTSKLRSPVVCVLGHVDTGKTKILDKIRRTNVQDGEAGGITQQIGATMVPQDALKDQCKMVKSFTEMELKLPGLLIIDTPGHESFSNLRSRGSSLCDIAILVVDIMHGLEPQTIESINLLKQKKTPFIVALNKVDRLYEWKTLKNRDIQDVIKNQARNTKMEFDDRAKDVILQFATQGLNAVLHYENTDPRSYISMVPTSAFTGDGMGNLMALVVQLTQSMMMKCLAFSEELQATVLEVKAISGLGTTIDAILVNGRLREGDTIVLAGYEGAIVTQIRSLLMPQPLKELRVKNFYQEFKEVEGSQGVKIAGKDLDKTIAGLQLLVANHPDEVAILKEEVTSSFKEAMGAIKVADRGVYVQASTLGSLEALLEFLRASKIPYAGIRIGPVVKKDVMKASIMLEHDSQFAVILAFDVKIERDAQELADSLGVKIFQADIIYHLFDKFMAFREELRNKKREEFKHVAIFPCKLRILPHFIFNSRDPIVVGVMVEAGVVKEGAPLCVPSKEFLEIGTVTTIEVNHKAMESARKGQEVCLKIEPSGGEAPKMYGRHFDHTDILVSKITRQSIDVCKEYFRDDLQKTDWQLMVELKKTFQIL